MANLEKIDVVFAIDKNFIQHFCVALTSLLETNREIVGKIFLINDIEEEETLLNKTFSFFKKKYKKEIQSLTLNKALAKEFRIDGHITQATYYRIFLADLLPINVEKVLFLDSDVIVNKNIEFFTKMDFQKQGDKQEFNRCLDHEWYLYAVNNVFDQNRDRLKALDLHGDKYFNAGVLLVNLRKWREKGISNKLYYVARFKKKYLKLHDQDVLNIVLENEWKEIDGRFNAINLEYSGGLNKMEDYAIIHFTNFPKPWHFTSIHPFKKLYWIYLRKTPFRFYIPGDLTFGNFMELKIIPRLKRLSGKLFNTGSKLLLKSKLKGTSFLNKNISN